MLSQANIEERQARTLVAITIVLFIGNHSSGQDSIYAKLAEPCRVSASETGAGTAIRRIATSHKINVWIDRRLDHSQSIRTQHADQSVEQALETIAEAIGGEVGFTNQVAIVAPPTQAIEIASAILALQQQLRASPGHVKMLRNRDVAWQTLVTPTEIAQQIADTWEISVTMPTLPHDLWADGELVQIDLPNAISLVAGGFGSMAVFDEQTGEFRWQTLDPAKTASIDYPTAKLSAKKKQMLRQIEPQVSFAANNGLIRVTGSSVVHHAIRKVVAGKTPPIKVDPSVKRFTLRVVGKPTISVLKAICNASGLQLDTSSASDPRLASLVELDVEDKPVTEIIEMIGRQANLSIDQTGDSVIVSDPL